MRSTLHCTLLYLACVAVSGPAVAAGRDACALLPAAEVSSILGATVGEGEPLSPTHREYCAFNETGKAMGAGRNAQLSIIDERKFTLGRTAIAGIEKSAESGLGDEAYWSKARGIVYVLSVRKGSSYLRVQSRTNKDALARANTPALDEQDRAADRKLALAALKRL